MSEINPELEQTKSTAKGSGVKKVKTSEFSLRIHLKGEIAKQVRSMADRATKNAGYPIPEGLLVAHALDLSKAAKWLDSFTNFLGEPIQHNG